MEKEVKQEQPVQELDDKKIETVSGGDTFKPTLDNEPQRKPGTIF